MSREAVKPEERLRELIRSFDTAVLVTHDGAGGLHARPLAVAEVDADDVLYFATVRDSGKVADVLANPRAQVILQDGRRYASLSGSVRVLEDDRALVERLWSEDWKLWFPGGQQDPSLCLLAFDTEQGEYWDRGGVAGLKFLVKAARAYATGTRPTLDERDHGKATL
jgi:general stress protein 26